MGNSLSPRLAALTAVEWRAFRAVCRQSEAVPLETVIRELANPEPPNPSTIANALSHARQKGWISSELRPKGARNAQFFSAALGYSDALHEMFLNFAHENDLNATDLEILKQFLAFLTAGAARAG